MIQRDLLETLVDRLAAAMKNLGDAGFRERYPSSLVSMETWEWPQGVGLFGLWKRYERTGNPADLEYLEGWYRRYLEYPALSPGPKARIARSVERNVNTTAPMLTLAFLYEKTRKLEYLQALTEWADWVETGLIRTGDGAFQHMITGDPNEGQILIDTIFMTLLFLAKASAILDRPDLAREVGYQVVTHAKYLLDVKTNLFFHGWDFPGRHRYGGVLWARGNAWYCAGLMELLEFGALEPTVARFLLTLYRNQAEALFARQDISGLWPTVLDDPSSYTEASATAGFLYGLARGVRSGFLPARDCVPALERAASGLSALIGEDGFLGKVSYGTPVGMSADFYKEIPICPMTYGQALAILAFQELLDPFWAGRLVEI